MILWEISSVLVSHLFVFQIGLAFQRLVVGGESGQVEPINDYNQISFSPGVDGRVNLENITTSKCIFVPRRCPPSGLDAPDLSLTAT